MYVLDLSFLKFYVLRVSKKERKYPKPGKPWRKKGEGKEEEGKLGIEKRKTVLDSVWVQKKLSLPFTMIHLLFPPFLPRKIEMSLFLSLSIA